MCCRQLDETAILADKDDINAAMMKEHIKVSKKLDENKRLLKSRLAGEHRRRGAT